MTFRGALDGRAPHRPLRRLCCCCDSRAPLVSRLRTVGRHGDRLRPRLGACMSPRPLCRPAPVALPCGSFAVSLTRGLTTVVDAQDLALATEHLWRAQNGGGGKAIYAARTGTARDDDANRSTLFLHRVICSAERWQIVDHADGDTLNNRRSNLRICGAMQNAHNRRPNRIATCDYKGVFLSKGRIHAQIRFDGVQRHLGTFNTAEAAARAYDAAASEYFGEFAYLNFADRPSLPRAPGRSLCTSRGGVR